MYPVYALDRRGSNVGHGVAVDKELWDEYSKAQDDFEDVLERFETAIGGPF